MRTLGLLLATLLIAAPTHSRADEWSEGAYRSQVFTAGIRNAASAGIDIECRATNYGRSEVTVELRVPASTGLKPTEMLNTDFISGDQTSALAMRLLGTEYDMTTYRWTAWDKAAYQTARTLADVLENASTLQVKDTGTGKVISFAVQSMSGSRASETIRRCGKEAMHAREQASRMTDPKVLMAFEGDADDKCRGGSGDDRSTLDACDARAEYYERLHALNWCYGKVGQIGADMTWHRCMANSIR